MNEFTNSQAKKSRAKKLILFSHLESYLHDNKQPQLKVKLGKP